MNRRELLKRISVVAPAAALVPVLSSLNFPIPSPNSPDDFMFHGWRCMWGGWRDLPNMDIKVGFWTAYGAKGDRWHLYSAWPGRVGPFVLGHVFDISLQKDQTMPYFDASVTEIQHYRNECLERLKRLIIKAGPPPLDPMKSLGHL